MNDFYLARIEALEKRIEQLENEIHTNALKMIVNDPIFENPIKDGKIQQQLTAILRAKKQVIGLSQLQLKRWELGTTSPSLETFEKVCKDNNIQVHYFFIYDLDSLLDFAKKAAENLGHKVVITFEGE